MTSGAWRKLLRSATPPVLGVSADFALRDDAIAMLVHEFNRVFDRDDMAARIAIAMIDHRRH
jgi:hypothetical protein